MEVVSDDRLLLVATCTYYRQKASTATDLDVRTPQTVLGTVRDGSVTVVGTGLALQVAAFTRILSWQRIAEATRDPNSYASPEANIRWSLENVASS